jgi:hypothetical protein
MIFSKRFYGRARLHWSPTVVRTNREEHVYNLRQAGFSVVQRFQGCDTWFPVKYVGFSPRAA